MFLNHLPLGVVELAQKSDSPALIMLPPVLDRGQDQVAVPMLWQRFLY